MPYAQIVSSVVCDESTRHAVCQAVSSAISEGTGKSEAYVMVAFLDAAMMLSGDSAPLAFVDIRGIGGIAPVPNAAITAAICERIVPLLGIEPAGVYVNFTDIAPSNWGWNGKTFG